VREAFAALASDHRRISIRLGDVHHNESSTND
jgi:hypothetical protein